MPHLDDVELVGVERLVRHGKRACARADGGAVREPAGCAAGEEGHKRRGRREDLPRPAAGTVAADDLVERPPFRHYFSKICAIPGTEALGLRPPGGDRYGLLRMSSKP